ANGQAGDDPVASLHASRRRAHARPARARGREVNTMQFLGAGLCALALAHTFSTKYFERLAHRRPDHAGAWHLLAEVEVVFGFWAMVLVVLMATVEGRGSAT